MRWALALGLLLLACSKKTEPTAASGSAIPLPASEAPHSQAPPASSLEPIANQGGWSLHPAAVTECGKDKKCLGEKCGPGCARFLDERFKSYATVGLRNRLYFACFGSCLGGPPDAAH